MNNLFEDAVLQELAGHARAMLSGKDPAHDWSHAVRVYKLANYIGLREPANMEYLHPAALLHDIDCQWSHNNESSEHVQQILHKYGYSDSSIEAICTIIREHSYSRNIQSSSHESAILQDADRLDASGAIGIARLFSVSGMIKSKLYSIEDAFCQRRVPSDKEYALDHLYTKILRLSESMNTVTAREMIASRHKFVIHFIKTFKMELELE